MEERVIQTTNFGLSQIEIVPRQRFQMCQKWREDYQYDKKKIIDEEEEIVHCEQFLLLSQCFYKTLWFELWIVRLKPFISPSPSPTPSLMLRNNEELLHSICTRYSTMHVKLSNPTSPLWLIYSMEWQPVDLYQKCLFLQSFSLC